MGAVQKELPNTEEFEIIAKTLYGLEEVLADEIKEIGGTDVQTRTRAVMYRGDKEVLYKSNYLLRTAIKVLKPIASFRIFNDHQLYRHVKRIPWEAILDDRDTLAIDAVTNSAIFRNSKYITLKSKDAVVDRLREQLGSRPSIDLANPTIRIHIHIDDKQCTVSLDSSGPSLDKRGYKTEGVRAPMSEVLAAGIIKLSGWNGDTDFCDPMCGSGTLPIEAALMARNIPVGKWRSFAFESWRDFDAKLWNSVKADAIVAMHRPACKIYAGEIKSKVMEVATGNARRAGVLEDIEFKAMDFLQTVAPSETGVLIMNPPYGERLEQYDEMIPFYGEVGTRLKHHYPNWDAWIFSANIKALKHVGLRPSRKIKLFNGALECRLQHFALYKGSKKGSTQES